MSKRKPNKTKLQAAFREVYADEPSTVTRANVHGERKRKMLAAIAFSKARHSYHADPQFVIKPYK